MTRIRPIDPRDAHLVVTSGFRLVDSGRTIEQRPGFHAQERAARRADAVMYAMAAACATWGAVLLLARCLG